MYGMEKMDENTAREKEREREKEFHYDHSDLMCHQRTACATAVLCTKMANLLLPCLSSDVILVYSFLSPFTNMRHAHVHMYMFLCTINPENKR